MAKKSTPAVAAEVAAELPVAAAPQPAAKAKGLVIDFGTGSKIKAGSVINSYYGVSGKVVDVTVPVLNEDGTREGIVLREIPERFVKAE
ncbi:hypothetical protein [Hymenobacter latericus]|uniref:hypothetical protein n=1 Tax=Hymenobacter sp. YIM 151858-1 TaxID=2987688 RepID=UPI002226D73D|nr:hypothetical protein [Hymenobacter sp. YIM 151858-1]UYZ60112.1 hypothetical protein OIS50_04750 [Hymenobacter sp. YIM 151858-1]